MKRAFTLIELLVICAILATMVTIGVGSIGSGRGAARVKGATRDVYAAIRHARSVALVTGQPAIITYSTVEEDGEIVAKIEVTTAKLFDSGFDRSKVQTLTGEPLKGEGYELVHVEEAAESKPVKNKAGTEEPPAEESSSGETIEEILFAPVNEDIVKGMRLKVVVGDEESDGVTERRPSKISVFSNVDYLLGRYKDAKKEAEEKAKTEGADAAVAKEPDQEPVSVVWETNGRVDPHQVWIYADGQKPEDGLLIRVDRFGGAKVLPGDGRDED